MTPDPGSESPRSRRRRWRRRERGESALTRLMGLRARAEARVPLITHLMSHVLSVNVLDSATRLAAQTFLTAVPLLFVVASIAPHDLRERFVDSLRDVFGLTGSADAQLRQAFLGDESGEFLQTTGFVSGLLVLISATACSRAMQRLCERAWRLPGAAARVAAWRWLAWLAAWLVMIGFQGVLRNGFGLGLWLGLPLLLVADVGLWWWTQHLLLTGRVPWAPLLPGALLTGAALSVLTSTATLYVPRALNHSLAAYGSLGAVFTLLSWLITLCVVIALCVTAGAVVAREPWAARLLGTPPALEYASPGSAAPGSGPSGSAPGGSAALGADPPDSASSGSVAPGSGSPGSAPGGSAPPGAVPPDSASPGSVAPGPGPSGSGPGGSAPPGAASPTSAASGPGPAGPTPPHSRPPGSVSSGSTAPGADPSGSTPPGSTPPGSAPPGSTSSASTAPGPDPPGPTPPGSTSPGPTPPDPDS
ncbi:YhjD/YihY/BrkB family envelope integrity protein [Streptomyces antibioticus]|uniref:YhjD/YihY/BrkB family envelope integrity protein n=1 Tax=Streptomyces antibioticus TaxID=1890 RepID=UPI00224E4FD4|nr:YhjD/YihY/BrkB family envelope integrity protein [Streptomyces antibioticus]MCX4737499.1 YihY/virulence factor BrkB family protein [Streptomyces antibioticus]